MRYLFFDIECANCLHGEGKICSFGYTLTDDSFEPQKKKDFLINPNAPFLLGNAKKGSGIRLAYPLFRFRQSYPFPHYYPQIKSLLEAKDTLVLGFSVKQDVGYLSYTVRRYHLAPISFRFYDVQLLEKELHHGKNAAGLDSLVKQYQLEEHTYHRSDEDALMTLEVFRALAKEQERTPQSLLEAYPDPLWDTERFEEERRLSRKKKELQVQRHRKAERFFRDMKEVSYDLSHHNPKVYGRKFGFDPLLLQEDEGRLRRDVTRLLREGGKLERDLRQADVLVRSDQRKGELRLPEPLRKPQISLTEWEGWL